MRYLTRNALGPIFVADPPEPRIPTAMEDWDAEFERRTGIRVDWAFARETLEPDHDALWYAGRRLA